MKRPARRLYEFGPFRLDADERQLLTNGGHVSLTPKVFDLLVLLVLNNRHTLEKSELMNRIWADAFVEENSLSRNISILRKTLGEYPGTEPYIKTVPKHGYRFEADVRIVVEDEEEVIVERRTNYSVTLGRETMFNAQVEGDARQFSARRVVAIASAIVMIGLLGIAVITSPTGADRAFSAERTAVETTAIDSQTLELYRRGRELWQDRSAAGLHEATLILEQAVERDPDFALALSALADAYAFDARNWKKVEETAAAAIRIDPDLGNPHAAVGFVKLFWEWKTLEAEKSFRRAISLSPDYATAHQWYAINLAIVGHFNEALAEMTRALELEPESPSINADMCQMLYFLRRYDEAENQCRKALAIDPRSFSAHSYLYAVYSAQGKGMEAIDAFLAREALSVNNASLPGDFEQLKAAFDRGGIDEFWREQIRLRKRSSDICGCTVAWLYVKLGEIDAAMKCLKDAAENREFDLVFIYADPVFRDLVDDARYQDLANRLMSSRMSR